MLKNSNAEKLECLKTLMLKNSNAEKLEVLNGVNIIYFKRLFLEHFTTISFQNLAATGDGCQIHTGRRCWTGFERFATFTNPRKTQRSSADYAACFDLGWTFFFTKNGNLKIYFLVMTARIFLVKIKILVQNGIVCQKFDQKTKLWSNFWINKNRNLV